MLRATVVRVTLISACIGICAAFGLTPDDQTGTPCGTNHGYDWIHCSDSVCIKSHQWCDGNNDCTFWQDEKNCTTRPACREESMWQCEAYGCTHGSERCDGYKNCDDNSDEIGCLELECEANDFQCADTGACKYQTVICDGKEDCNDGSDEANCTQDAGICEAISARQTKYPSPLSTCSDGRCVLDQRVCNGKNDCGDWSDETDCFTKRGDCGWKWQCGSGACIYSRDTCDGKVDCQQEGDGKDEEGCEPVTTEPVTTE